MVWQDSGTTAFMAKSLSIIFFQIIQMTAFSFRKHSPLKTNLSASRRFTSAIEIKPVPDSLIPQVLTLIHFNTKKVAIFYVTTLL